MAKPFNERHNDPVVFNTLGDQKSHSLIWEMATAGKQTVTKDFIDKLKDDVHQIKALSSHQLRNIFLLVKNAHTTSEAQLIRPRLLYLIARLDLKTDNPIRKFLEKIEETIALIDNDQKLKGFQLFFESVVAIHKYYNPKN